VKDLFTSPLPLSTGEGISSKGDVGFIPSLVGRGRGEVRIFKFSNLQIFK
jgi:hypothetical protein